MQRMLWLVHLGGIVVAAAVSAGVGGERVSGGAERAVVRSEIYRIASKWRVNPVVVEAIADVESGLNPHAVSRKGAVGVMQVMPRTGHAMGLRNLFDVRENVEAGVRYLRYLGIIFHGDLRLALAAYNAGEGSVVRYKGVPPYMETRAYVEAVIARYYALVKRAGSVMVEGPAQGLQGCGLQTMEMDKSGRLVVRLGTASCGGHSR